MAQTEPSIPSGKKYLAAWITAQVILNASWLGPWVTNQIKAANQTDATLAAPDASKAIHAGIAFLLSTLLVFAHKVWKELEADAVKGTANLIKGFPHMAWELLGRCKDAIWGFCTRWFIRWGFTRRYLAELRYRYGLFNDKGMGLINANRLDLDKVYVELKASPDVNLNNPRMNPVSRVIGKRAPLWEHLRTLRPGFALAIIGAPGGGKTTLLQHILLTFARNRQWRCRMRFRIPIFIELRKITPALLGKTPPTLPKLIETLWKQDTRSAELMKQMPKGWLDARLRSGRCILLWDGLDEVAEPAQRTKVRDWLESAAIGNPDYRGNLSLVSARPAGYKAARLEHAQVLEVQPFDWQDTKRFSQQWYHANEVVSAGHKDNAEVRRRAMEGSQDLLRRLQDNAKLGDLAVNPLLLTMMCMVHRYHGALPGSRSQLYDEICQVLLERWRQQRDVVDPFSGPQKLEVLRPLAVWLMEHKTKDISEAEMLAVIAEPLARIGVPAGEAAAKEFIHHLRDSSGLWLERELGVWAFAHLSFQEHLCADAWAQDAKRRPAAWAPLLGDAWWRETLLLYAVKAKDATPLAMAALDGTSAEARAFAFDLQGEKINIDAATRDWMEARLGQSLRTKNEPIFLPAAEAWLLRRSRQYHRLDEHREISGWVTQAEYQVFELSNGARPTVCYSPLHQRSRWFSGSFADPVLGLSGEQAAAFCQWLNEQFPAWQHRLPADDEELNAVPVAPEGLLVWIQSQDESIRLQSATTAWKDHFGKPMAGTAHTASTLGIAMDTQHLSLFGMDAVFARYLVPPALARDRVRDLARDFDLVRDLVRDLARNLDLNSSRARGFDLVPARDLARDLTRDLAHKLDLGGILDLGRNFSTALAATRASDLDRVRVRVIQIMLSLGSVGLAAGTARSSARASMVQGWQKQLGALIEATTWRDRERPFAQSVKTLLPELISETPDARIQRGALQRLSLLFFDSARREDPKQITPEIAKIETALRLIVARSEGKAPVWEGLRVVRERRT